MSFIQKLKKLKIDPTTMVTLTYVDGVDVFIHNESEVETALAETNVIEEFCELIATPGLNATTMYGTPILEELRASSLLEEYERGTQEFAQYLTDVINDNFYEFDFIDTNIQKFDHKRGFCELRAEVKIPAGELIDSSAFVNSWTVSVPTETGELTLD
tara:strand:+ start:1209 stop:1682 length:474 start_codon:yes stop_codon:yes gene_type:complete